MDETSTAASVPLPEEERRRAAPARRPGVAVQVLSFARPVVVLLVVPALIAWLASPGWPGQFRLSLGVGDGGVRVVTAVAGVVLVAVGQVWFWWAEGVFIANGLTLDPEHPPTQLVTWGPFRYCTSPMFTGVLLCLHGECLLVSPWVAVFVPVFLHWLFGWYLPAEEASLALRFGAQWTEYTARVWRGVIPFGVFSARWRSPRRQRSGAAVA
jgi:protein-S-isoprenylcysteine O-methyltransferase Ste14